jgi:hypothetical protein
MNINTILSIIWSLLTLLLLFCWLVPLLALASFVGALLPFKKFPIRPEEAYNSYCDSNLLSQEA